MTVQFSLQSNFQANHGKIAAETIDGEAIVIHLETGAYYSLRESAEFLWQKLLTGASAAGLVSFCQQKYSGLPANLEGEIKAFIEELLTEDLVVALAGSDTLLDEAGGDIASTDIYSSPTIEKFTDMADLLLLDPIHEVSQEGWPFKKNPDSQ